MLKISVEGCRTAHRLTVRDFSTEDADGRDWPIGTYGSASEAESARQALRDIMDGIGLRGRLDAVLADTIRCMVTSRVLQRARVSPARSDAGTPSGEEIASRHGRREPPMP
jgi:hypothetical protein